MSHQASYSGIKVLIVDDERAIRAMVLKVASGWGYDGEESPNAENALSILEKARYNIVVTDIKMGKMDGIAFAEKIREKMPSTAVVIMTGFPSPATAKKAQTMGAVYYLQKPIGIDELGETLKIAAAWNVGMLIDRASRRFLALRKGDERDQVNRLKAIKFEIKRDLNTPGASGRLRDFVYSANAEKCDLFTHLNQRFSSDSVKPF